MAEDDEPKTNAPPTERAGVRARPATTRATLADAAAQCERYAAFLRQLPAVVFGVKLDSTPAFIQGAVEALTGYSEAEILAGEPRWADLVHPDLLERTELTPRQTLEKAEILSASAALGQSDRIDVVIQVGFGEGFHFRVVELTQRSAKYLEHLFHREAMRFGHRAHLS